MSRAKLTFPVTLDRVSMGARLKACRDALGYSQSFVAEQIGFKSANGVKEHEKGKTAISDAQLLAYGKLYGRTVDWFMDTEGIVADMPVSYGGRTKEERQIQKRVNKLLQKDEEIKSLLDIAITGVEAFQRKRSR